MSKRASRSSIPLLVRRSVMRRDGGSCVYCGDVANVIDHVVPYSCSRNNRIDNLVACCQTCNYVASDLIFGTLEEKSEYIMTVRAGIQVNVQGVVRGRAFSESCICSCCRTIFPPMMHGATNILCAECANKPSNMHTSVSGKYERATGSKESDLRHCARCDSASFVVVVTARDTEWETWYLKSLCRVCLLELAQIEVGIAANGRTSELVKTSAARKYRFIVGYNGFYKDYGDYNRYGWAPRQMPEGVHNLNSPFQLWSIPDTELELIFVGKFWVNSYIESHKYEWELVSRCIPNAIKTYVKDVDELHRLIPPTRK